MKHLLMLLLLAGTAFAQNAVVATPGQRSVTLNWTESTPNVTSFKVYRGLTAGGENYGSPLATVPGTANTYLDSSVGGGQTYFYTVTALLGVESVPSNEVSAQIPTAPASPSLSPAVVN